jgi:Tol biopolymer transport system component
MRKIVFANGATLRRILTVNPDGTGLDTLTGTGEYHNPVWSPDFKTIAYTVGDGGAPPIYTMTASGTRPT